MPESLAVPTSTAWVGDAVPKPATYRDPQRVVAGITAQAERRILAWLAPRLPDWVKPDHLTALGLLANLIGGALYAASGRWPGLLLAVNLALALNWFGDSLDGTLARHRRRERPRFGFYVDHVVDAFGALFLLGGLMLSGRMTPAVGVALLTTYHLFGIHTYLATHVLGRFKISYGAVGGTELRILLALANVAALLWPRSGLFGGVWLFDLVAGVGTVVLAIVLLRSVVQVTRELHRLERRAVVVSPRPLSRTV
jgi:phosphatidylglycerophosphate synthase